jgi:uncharacterized coiled-coil DUF342 family protein
MKTIAVIMIILTSCILSGIGTQNGIAGEHYQPPIIGHEYTMTVGPGSVYSIYYLMVYKGENITINVTDFFNGGPLPTDNNYVIQIGAFYTSSSPPNGNCATYSQEASVWVIAAFDQLANVYIALNDNGGLATSFNYVINVTPTLPDPIKGFQDQINELTNNYTEMQNQIQNLTEQVDRLNSTISSMNDTQMQILENVTDLWMQYDHIHELVHELQEAVDKINLTPFENLSQNITWLEENISKNMADIEDILNQIDDLSKDKVKLKEVQDQLNDTLKDIAAINGNITQIKNTMPDEYNDVVLKNKINLLETNNTALKSQNTQQSSDITQLKGDNVKLNGKNKEMSDNINALQQSNNWMMILLGIMIIVQLIGLALIFSRRSKPQKDDEAELPDEKRSEEE